MATDKIERAKRTGKSTAKAKPSTRVEAEDNDNVVSFTVAGMRTEVLGILDKIEAQDIVQDTTGQLLVKVVANAYKAYTTTATNLTKIAAIHDMVDAQRKLTEGAKSFAKDLKADWLGKRISKPGPSISKTEPDLSKRAARYAADSQAIDRAVKAFIAASVNGGQVNTSIWDDERNCLRVPSANFLPLHNTKTEKPYVFLDETMPKLVALTGQFYCAWQPTTTDSIGSPKAADGKFTMTNLIRTFFNTSRDTTVTPQADTTKGADQNSAAQIDPKVKTAALKGADFFELIHFAHAIMTADKTKPIKIADVDGDNKIMEELRDIAMLYSRLTTEAQARVGRPIAQNQTEGGVPLSVPTKAEKKSA